MQTRDTDLLFQTDDQLAETARRRNKREVVADIGSPFILPNKALDIVVHENQIWIAEAGWQARCLDLKVGAPVHRGCHG
jgi:hypothetical protein